MNFSFKQVTFKQAIVAYVVAALVVNPAMAQQQSAGLIKQQQARAIAERLSVDRTLSVAQALELVSSNNAADPALKEALNGTTVVDIAAPSAKGVSNNNWNEFNVGEEGIIFNNSAAPVLTQLGGWSDGNRRLAGGEANIILNQVTGANRSTLLGQIEVAGKSAEFILANANGITCNGCGFINTPNVSLITGQSRFAANGDLTFDISSGDFLLEGKGLNATNIDRFDIVSRYAQLNANLYANNLNVINGVNQFNYNTKNITATTSSSNGAIQYAFDTTALGGMYANTIRLIGTETGLGVNLQGVVQSTQDLSISADGNLQLKHIQANNQLTAESISGSVNTEELIYAPNVSIKAADTITNLGFMAAKDEVTLSAKNINQSGDLYAGLNENNQFNSTGKLNLTASESLTNLGDFYIGGQLNLTVGTLENNGIWSMQTADSLTADQIINHNTLRFNAQDANLTANSLINDGEILHLGNGLFTGNLTGDFDNTGTFGSNGNLQLTGNLLNNQGQIFANQTTLSLNTLNNNQGQIETTTLILNANNLLNQNGRILSLGDALSASTISIANNLDNQSGVIYVDTGSFALNAQNLDNTSGNFIINNAQASTMQIDNQLNNQKGFFQTNQLNITTLTLDNSEGDFLASGLNGTFDSINNTQGFIQGTQLSLYGKLLNNSGGVVLSNGKTASTLQLEFTDSITNNNDAVIRNTNGDIDIAANHFTNTDSLIDASNNGSINILSPELNNQSGRLLAKNTIQFTNQSVNNIDGYMEANQIDFAVAGNLDNSRGLIQGKLNIAANQLNNTEGYLLLTDTSAISLIGDLQNQQGVIATWGNTPIDSVTLSANSIFNQGELAFNAQQLTISAAGQIDNTGLIENSQALNLQATDLLNRGGSISADQLQINLDNQLTNSSLVANNELTQGQITANTLQVSANNTLNDLYSLIYSDELQIDSDILTNNGLIVSDQILLEGDQLINNGDLLSATINTDSLVLNFLTQITNNGQISRNDDWSVTTSELINHGRIESLGYGNISANSIVNTDTEKQNAASTAINVNTDQGFISASGLSISTTDFDNQYGVLLSGDVPANPLANGLFVPMNNSVTAINNENGFIQFASQDWLLEKVQLHNRNGSIWHLGSGELNANLVGDLDNTGGSIISDGNLFLVLNDTNSNLINSAGLIAANDTNISVNNTIDNLNKGTITGANLELTASTINNNNGVIEADAMDTATLSLDAAQVNNINGGEIRSGAKNWNMLLDGINNQGGSIIHTGSGQLSVESTTQFINEGTIYSARDLLLNIDSLDNRGDLFAENNLSINTINGITNNTTGNISAINQLDLIAENQTIHNDGYWFFGQSLSNTTSLIGSEFVNNGEWILGDNASHSFELTFKRLTNHGWMSYNNSGDLIINADQITNTQYLLSNNGRIVLNADNAQGEIINSGLLQAGAIDVSGNKFTNSGSLRALAENQNTIWNLNQFLNDQGLVALSNQTFILEADNLQNHGRIESSGDINIISTQFTNTDLNNKNADNLSRNLQNNNGVLIANQLTVKADSIDNQFGMILSQSESDNGLKVEGNTQAPLVFNNNKGFVQSSANNWQIDNFHLINTNGGWLHLGSGKAEFNLLGDLDNTSGNISSSGELVLTLNRGVNYSTNNLQNHGGMIDANRLTITASDINNTKLYGTDNTQSLDDTAGTLTAGNIILNASVINNQGGIIDANAANNAELQLNAATINNIEAGELRSAATDWSLTLDSINNQGGKILHTGTGSLTLAATGNFLNQGTLYSRNNLVLDFGSLINAGNISANNLTISTALQTDPTQFSMVNQTTGSIYAINHTQLNAQNQNLDNQGDWYFGNSATFATTGSTFTNNGDFIFGNAAQPTSNNVDLTLGSFINTGVVSYNNTGNFTINANQIDNSHLIISNTGSSVFNLTGTANTGRFNNSGNIYSKTIQLETQTSGHNAINSGRLQANLFDFTNVDLINNLTGIIFGVNDSVGNEAEFNFINSRITNNGNWINQANDWTLSNPIGSGQFYHQGTGALSLTFNAANSLANTTYISTMGSANITGDIVGEGDATQRTTIYANNNVTFTGNLNNQGAWISSNQNLIVNGNLVNDVDGKLRASGDLRMDNTAANFDNQGNIQANRFSIIANQLTNAGSLLAIGEDSGNTLLSSIHANSIDNSNGVIQINNASGDINSATNLDNSAGVIAKNNAGTLNLSANNTLDNTDGLITAEEGNLVLMATSNIINQQNPVANPVARGIYANQLSLTANSLNNQSGIISVNAIDNSRNDNLITVNDINNDGGTIQLSHFNQNPNTLDSLTLIVTNSLDNQNGSIQLLNIMTNTTPDEDYPGPLRNAAGDTQLTLTTANLNNQNGAISSDGRFIINSQNTAATKTLLTNAGHLQALGDLTINAAGLNNAGKIVGGENAEVLLNLNGFNLVNTAVAADIFSFNQLTINANQINNAQKIQAKNQMDITTQGFASVGTIQSGNLLNITLQSDLALGVNDTLATPGALSITTAGDITNAGTISAANHLLLNADNLLNDTTGKIVAGVGSQASRFTINAQFVNRGLVSSLGDLEIFTPEFINANGGSVVTGLYLNQTNEVIAGSLTFDLNIPADFNSGRFTNEGVIYSQGNLDIVDALSVFNQNNATLMSQVNMIINADELINDQSRIETIVGNLTLNINHDLINRSDAPTYTASALSGSYSGSATTPGDSTYNFIASNGYTRVITIRHVNEAYAANIYSGADMTISGSANIENIYSSIYSANNLTIDGNNLNNIVFSEGYYEERISVGSAAGTEICDFQGCISHPVYYWNATPRPETATPFLITDYFGSIRAGGTLTINIQNEITNTTDDVASAACNPLTDSACQATAPTSTNPIDDEFAEALNNLLPDEFRDEFGLAKRILLAEEIIEDSLAANDSTQTGSGNTAGKLDSIDANTKNESEAEALSRKTLSDVTEDNASDGAGSSAQHSAFAGETGNQGAAADKSLSDNADETSDGLTSNIPPLIAKANEEQFKTNQWPLISFTVLPFNFDLNNLSGLYVLSQNPNSHYLIETRPEFTLYQNFLGSDYLLKELGYDADKTIKRLGDAFFENQLIRDALIKETNSRYLGAATNDFDLMTMLMNNAVATASSLQLSIGVALTPEQCASLTQDMMWLVKKKVGGQEVLVPQLYLTSVSPEKIAASKAAIGANGNISLSANSINNQSSMYAGNNLSLTADLLKNTSSLGAAGNLLLSTRGNLEQDGRLFAQGDVRLLAAGSISNNGSIDANNVIAIAQDNLLNTSAGQINAKQNILLQSTQANVTNQQGAIHAENIRLDANKNVELTGNLMARNNLTLIAGEDVLLKATKEETRLDTKKIKANTVQYTATNLSAGGNIVVDAGRDVQAEGSDFTAGGNINLHADNDINLQALKNEDNYQYQAKRKKEIHNTTEYDVVNINSGGTVVIDAGRDNNLTGTTIAANDNVFISADRDTNISAVVDSDYDYSYSKKKKSFGRSKTKIDETLVENVVGGTIDAGGNVLINAHVNSDGKLITDTSGKVNILGAVINADENVVISGDEDVNISGIEYEELDYHQRKKSGVGGFSKKDQGASVANQLLENASLSAGKNIHLMSGNDLNLVAADVVAEGNVNMEAVNQLLIAAGDVKTQTEEWKKSSGLFTNGDIYNKKVHKEGERVVSGQASNIVAGGKVNAAVGSGKIIGSNIIGDQGVQLVADAGDIDVTTYQQHSESFTYDKEISVGFGDLVDKASRPDQMIENKDGRATLTFANASYDEVDNKTKILGNQESTIQSNSDVTLIATAGSVNIQGSDVTADVDGFNGGSVGLVGATGVNITEATDTYESKTKEIHGTAEMSVVVQHQAVEVVKAVVAVDEAKDKLEKAKRDYKNYERNVDQLEEQLTQLENDVANKVPGAHMEDLLELRELVGDMKGDKEFYQAGIALAAVNVTTSITALIQQTAAAAQSAATMGFNAGVQLDIDATKSTTEEKSTTARGSNISGNQIVIQTGTLDDNGKLNTENTQTTISGSNLIAAQSKNDSGDVLKSSIDIETGDLNILSSKNTTENSNKTEHGHTTAQMTVYGASGGASMNGSYDQSKSVDKSTTINNSQLNADNITLTTSNDLTIRGANVRADEHLEVDVAGNMNLESQQNRSNSRNLGFGVSGGMSFGGTAESSTKKNADSSANNRQGFSDIGNANGVNGGLNTSNGMSVTRETVLTSLTSGGTANVKVKGTTYNTGALLATTDENGVDLNKLNFETGDYVSTDLRNLKQNTQTSIGVSSNFGISGEKPNAATTAKDTKGRELNAQTSNLNYSNINDNSASKSLATLGHGNIMVGGVQLERDGELTESGKADGSALIGVNRNTEETEKTLWDSSQSQTVDASLDHRLLSEGGRQAIKNDFVDTKEFGQDIARATSAISKEEDLKITNFWSTLDNNTKATQLKNDLIRDPNNAEILENLKGDPEKFAMGMQQLGQLAQDKFGISSEEFGKIFLYDGNKTSSTSLGNTLFADTKGGTVTDKNNKEAGNIFINANSGVKTDMVNTLGHETIELLTFITGGKNDATQEAQANVFGTQFSDRVNQAAGSDLDSTGGSNFKANLNSSWSVIDGTTHANNVGNSNTDNRRVKVKEAETLDRYRAKIDQNTQLNSDEKQIAHVQLNALTCAAIECADGVPREDPRYAQLAQLQALGEELNAQGTSLKTVLGDQANEQFEHGLMDDLNERITRHDEGISRTGGAAQATAGAAGMAGGVTLATAGGVACPVTGLSCFGVPAGIGITYLSEKEGEEGLNRLFGDYAHTEGQAVINSFSVVNHPGDNNPVLDLTISTGENAAMLVAGKFGAKYLDKVLDKVDSVSAPSVDVKVLDDLPERMVTKADEALALPSPTYNVPNSYTVKVNPNGTATVTGPRGGQYQSTGFYDGNGSPIYKGASGEYVTLNGSRVVVNAPPDYSTIPIHHVCTNKCNIGQNGKTAWTPKYQEFFDGADLNIDNAMENLVAVPGHRGPHPEAYHQYVFGSLEDATRNLTPNTTAYKNVVTNTLNRIKRDALTPGSRVNNWLTGQ